VKVPSLLVLTCDELVKVMPRSVRRLDVNMTHVTFVTCTVFYPALPCCLTLSDAEFIGLAEVSRETGEIRRIIKFGLKRFEHDSRIEGLVHIEAHEQKVHT
jgi:hypothetical protein